MNVGGCGVGMSGCGGGDGGWLVDYDYIDPSAKLLLMTPKG